VSGSGLHSETCWLVFLFVALDASKSLAVSWAALNGHGCDPLMIGAKNALSIGFGMLLAACLDGRAGLRRCLDMRRAMNVLPISCLFCAAQVFALSALRAFDAGSLKVLAQVNLPTTALLSWAVLGRRYSGQQWLAMALLLSATMAFMQVRMLFFTFPRGNHSNGIPEKKPDKVQGMMLFLTGITLSCCASIFAERFLKKRAEVPFYIQKTNIMFGELVTAALMAKFVSLGRGGEDTCSWDQILDWRQLPVLLIWFVHGWIAGLLVKRCSALIKNVSHILSALVTYFLPIIFAVPHVAHSWPVTLSALLVLAAVLVFATVPLPKEAKSGRHVRPKRAKGGQRLDLAGRLLPRSNSENALRANPQLPKRSPRALDQTPPGPTSGWHSTGLDRRQISDPPSDWHQRQPVVCSAPVTVAPATPAELVGEPGPWCCSVWLLVLSFIFLDATKPLLMTWTHRSTEQKREQFIHGTFVLVQTSISLLVGLIIAAGPRIHLVSLSIRLHPRWRQRIGRCVHPRAVLQRLPVSGCLCMSKLFLVMALGRLDAGTVRVFGQASLPLVGLGSALFFKRRYTLQQWASVVAISVALVTFYYVKAEVQASRAQQEVHVHEHSHSRRRRRLPVVDEDALSRPEVAGVLFVLASICFNCCGAFLMERFLKGAGRSVDGKIFVQKSQLLLGEVAINSAVVFVIPLFLQDDELRAAYSPWHRGFFAGWDKRVFLCALVWIPAGWTATMVVKRCSNLLKIIAQGTSSVLTYIFTIVPLHRGPRQWSYIVSLFGPPLAPEPVSSPIVLLAVTVMLATICFGTDHQRRAAARPGEPEGGGGLGSRKPERGLQALSEASRAGAPKGVDAWDVDGAYRIALPPRRPPGAGAGGEAKGTSAADD